jgi:Pyruvate/2-oxoacid:ferredoxin oxidoreductase gamma subunit
MHEIIWHGRGGQGVVLAAQILAEAAYYEGYKGVTSAPTFGPERRGAPLTASTRMSENRIRTVSQIEILIINTPMPPDKFDLTEDFHVATSDASSISVEANLTSSGSPFVNTPMLGAFARATGLVSIEQIKKALIRKMSREEAAINFSVAKTTYERTLVEQFGGK